MGKNEYLHLRMIFKVEERSRGTCSKLTSCSVNLYYTFQAQPILSDSLRVMLFKAQSSFFFLIIRSLCVLNTDPLCLFRTYIYAPLQMLFFFFFKRILVNECLFGIRFSSLITDNPWLMMVQLRFLYFMMAPKWSAFSRFHTRNLECGSFPRLGIQGVLLSQSSLMMPYGNSAQLARDHKGQQPTYWQPFCTDIDIPWVTFSTVFNKLHEVVNPLL